MFMRKVFGVIGVVLITISLMFIAMAAHDLITGDNQKTERGTLFGLLALFGAHALTPRE
jgi:hypothetical protein